MPTNKKVNPNVIDADAFIKAMLGTTEAPILRMYGRDWTLATELPVLVRLRLNRAMSPDEEITATEELEILRALLGAEQYEDLLNNGLTPTGVTAMLLTAMSHYSGMDANETLTSIADNYNSDNEDNVEEEAEKPAPKAVRRARAKTS